MASYELDASRCHVALDIVLKRLDEINPKAANALRAFHQTSTLSNKADLIRIIRALDNGA